MVDWLEIREEEEFLISGSVSREEFEAEITTLNSRSLFDKRLKSVLRDMLDEEDGDHIHVEALVRKGNIEK